MSEKEPSGLFTGAFSVLSMSKVGAGTTVQKHVQTMYAYVEEQPDGTYSVRYLNDAHVPVGKPWTITRDELLKDFTPEPELYANQVFPAVRELNKTISRAERMREKGQNYTAEYEFKKALRIDETNIRATFGFGLTYLDRGEAEKADLVFRRLVTLEAAFDREHKHLFNEFGIKLRKSGLADQALKYYARAVEFSEDDENLHYNRARVLADMGEDAQALEALLKALAINPDFLEGRKFRAWLEKRLKSATPAASGEGGGFEEFEGMGES